MAKTVTLYKIFIASPSDLKEERSMIEEIIDELNLSTFIDANIKIELKKWETHVNPDIGEYPQQVINNDIGDDYDIFLGMLWSKFGSPTEKYGSGTEEEFYRAYSKYKKDPTSIGIMFYFKQTALPLDKIDTASLNSIREFKSKLGDNGVLYWEYNTIEEFQKLLRIQLTRKIKDLNKQDQNTTTIVKVEEIEEEIELGVLDYIELGEESFKNVEEILLRMTDAIEWIGKRFNERTAEINKQTSLHPDLGTKARKRLVNAAADDMISFNARLSAEIPLFSSTYRKAIDSFSNATKISIGIKADELEDIEFAIQAIDTFVETIVDSSGECISFRDSLDDFPRMTKEFNRAKRMSSAIVSDLIQEFEVAINLVRALRQEFDEYKSMY